MLNINNQIPGNVNRLREHLLHLRGLTDEKDKLPKQTVALLKEIGISRMLQPKEFGGLESHPCDFLKLVMEIASAHPAAGWTAAVIGVHPWEAALNDDRLLQEIWGENPDTWIASPYSPMGIASQCDGGYKLNGRWTFSSATDYCEWVVLGAIKGDEYGKPVQPPEVLHVMLPRKDYKIIDDSWNVCALHETGSKDVLVEGAFIPTYRVIESKNLFNGVAFENSNRTEILYKLPWSFIFPNAITAAVLGICDGAVRVAFEYVNQKISTSKSGVGDPFILTAFGEAASEVRAAQETIINNVQQAYDCISENIDISLERRAQNRCDQVRVTWRAVRAVNEIFNRCGGGALREDAPLHKFWRDANAGLNHATFVAPSVYEAYSAVSMGIATEEQILRALI